jgi:hypothetical protein
MITVYNNSLASSDFRFQGQTDLRGKPDYGERLDGKIGEVPHAILYSINNIYN